MASPVQLQHFLYQLYFTGASLCVKGRNAFITLSFMVIEGPLHC
jgi:hypothetical protein